MTAPLLKVSQLTHEYALPRQHLFKAAPKMRVLNGLSFSLQTGQSLGIVGESGAGKSTLARLIMALEKPTSGSVEIKGRNLHTLRPKELRQARADFQMVFQDPYGSLDPRQTIAQIVCEPFSSHATHSRQHQRAQAAQVLESVGLHSADLDKYPHQFSGGQRQRIAIARALITRPSLIIADEPVSALDVCVQAQVLNLMRDLQTEWGVTYLLISHDLAVVNYLCDEVAVLYQGNIVEQGAPHALFQNPQHSYTKRLVNAVPPLS